MIKRTSKKNVTSRSKARNQKYAIGHKGPRKKARGKRHLVILVQGTFAGDTGAGSLGPKGYFATRLRRALGTTFVVPNQGEKYNFRWSGENTEDARVNAASKLLLMIASAERDSSIDTYSIIGHSHGGTVVWLALIRAAHVPDLELSKLNKWITVGTPFYSHGLEQGLLGTPVVRPDMERRGFAKFGRSWLGISHPLDEALGLLTTIQGIEVEKLPDIDAPLLQRLALGWGSLLLKQFATKAAFSTRMVGEVSPYPRIGLEKPRNRFVFLFDKATSELESLSKSEFQKHGLDAFASLRSQLADGKMKAKKVDVSRFRLTEFLIHCLYFRSSEILGIIATALKPTAGANNKTTRWIEQALRFSMRLSVQAALDPKRSG